MRYISTRGGSSISFEDAIFAGWADNGKYMNQKTVLALIVELALIFYLGGMLLPLKLEPLGASTLLEWRYAYLY